MKRFSYRNQLLNVEQIDRLDKGYFSEMMERTVNHPFKPVSEYALTLFGFQDPAAIRIRKLSLEKKSVALGDRLGFEFEVASDGPLGKVRVEYAVYFLKKNGSLSRKIFQLAEFETTAKSKSFKRHQNFKNYSTRKHYSGGHAIAIVVNGVEKKKAHFDLSV